ncbi:MAG: NUDIX hydrolase YfcD [Pseudomonadota bacterium]
MAKEEEIVVIVDEDNHVIGAEPRSRMRAGGMAHRATYILVFNSRGEMFVQKRTGNKDIYPGFYDVAAGGVVSDGETYDACAERELEEEMGIRGVPLEGLFDFYHVDGATRIWGKAYRCLYDGDIVLQEEEVESGEFLGIEEILRRSQREPFTPDGLYVLRRYLDGQ